MNFALVVVGNVGRETLEVLRGGGLGSPPGVQLCRPEWFACVTE
jgi:hypothetical protein